MSDLGFVMLCHTALHRAAQVARHLAERGCPVVIHVDGRVAAHDFAALRRDLGDLDHVRFAQRVRCDWGTWSLVQAAQAGAEMMLATCPDVRHVYLISGSCLPLRPIEELRAYLAARPTTDFIESVTIEDADWIVGGLSEERFKLRFPFSWKRQRVLFDAYVALQRRFGYRRRLPDGIAPHLGSQWWCLTRQTLSAMLQDPRRGMLEQYFRHVWIPDESYFQTLVRAHSHCIESRSLTLSKFDVQGKPHVFYDDHLHLLRRSDCFVARKIWPGADRLYANFLASGAADSRSLAEPAQGQIDKVFARSRARRTRGRAGLYMHSRFPKAEPERGKTAAPYTVFCGFDDLFVDFEAWLSRRLRMPVHGHIFAPDGAQFADGGSVYAGGLSANPVLRDYVPERFLTSLIWNTRGARQLFMFGPGDNPRIGGFMANDANEQIMVITGAWAVPLHRANRSFDDIRQQAARLQRQEVEFVAALGRVFSRAHVRIWTLADFLKEPIEILQDVLTAAGGTETLLAKDAPIMADLSGLERFLKGLKNQGMNPVTTGDVGLVALDHSRTGDGNPAVLVG